MYFSPDDAYLYRRFLCLILFQIYATKATLFFSPFLLFLLANRFDWLSSFSDWISLLYLKPVCNFDRHLHKTQVIIPRFTRLLLWFPFCFCFVVVVVFHQREEKKDKEEENAPLFPSFLSLSHSSPSFIALNNSYWNYVINHCCCCFCLPVIFTPRVKGWL